MIPTFAFSTDNDGVVVNLYDSGTAQLNLRHGPSVVITTETRYPAAEDINLSISPEKSESFAVKVRIPAWCKNPEIKINDKKIQTDAGKDGYVALKRQWKKDDKIQLRFPLEPRLVMGNRHNENRLAVMYGPLVLAADEAFVENKDTKFNALGVPNSNLSKLHFQPEPEPEKLKSWPGAEMFKVDATEYNLAPAQKSEKPFRIGLVPYADAGASGTTYKIWLPYKAARPDRNLLTDGIEIRSRKPNSGSIVDDNVETIASTFNNKRAPDDWFGVQLDEPALIKQVVFVHGKTFHDGGWFDASAGKPRVQIKTKPDGAWETIADLKDYPATTAKDAAGLKGGERFVCNLPKAMEVFAVRTVGKPASGDNAKQAFSSCAELHAFAESH